tara:strand:+ start:435 stop:788 length:354 start_codon:yes stop_codon:yes gene_type:complete
MKELVMQRTVDSLIKSNPKYLKELESGGPFEVLGNPRAPSGTYYKRTVLEMDANKKYRKLLDGTNVEELDNPHTLFVITKCPEKWILQDIETGELYRGSTDSTPKNQWKSMGEPPTV